jgi:hypothetical protein
MATETAQGANFCMSTATGATIQGLSDAANALIDGANKTSDNAKYTYYNNIASSTTKSVKQATIDELINELYIRYNNHPEKTELCKEKGFEKIKVLLSQCDNYYVITKKLYDNLKKRQDNANKASLIVSGVVSNMNNYVISKTPNLFPSMPTEKSAAIGTAAAVAGPHVATLMGNKIIDTEIKKPMFANYDDTKTEDLRYEEPKNNDQAIQAIKKYEQVINVTVKEKENIQKLIQKLDKELKQIPIKELNNIKNNKEQELKESERKYNDLNNKSKITDEANHTKLKTDLNLEMMKLEKDLEKYTNLYNERNKERKDLNTEIKSYKKILDKIDSTIDKNQNIIKKYLKYLKKHPTKLDKFNEFISNPINTIGRFTRKKKSNQSSSSNSSNSSSSSSSSNNNSSSSANKNIRNTLIKKTKKKTKNKTKNKKNTTRKNT